MRIIVKKDLAKLVRPTKPGDKYIFTSRGTYKLRKNGRIILSVGEGDERETVRVSPCGYHKQLSF